MRKKMFLIGKIFIYAILNDVEVVIAKVYFFSSYSKSLLLIVPFFLSCFMRVLAYTGCFTAC